mmetsp:Transcript_43606/g.108324  ORF Transcript_43606/g.108324 Transcript_43606/m.108324 type:complete len:268 (-) Transcript_43606:853-1656(-)
MAEQVCVLPLPVCPKLKSVPTPPSNALCTSPAAAALCTSAEVARSPNAAVGAKVSVLMNMRLRSGLCRHTCTLTCVQGPRFTCRPPSTAGAPWAVTTSNSPAEASSSKSGRLRTYTRSQPDSRISICCNPARARAACSARHKPIPSAKDLPLSRLSVRLSNICRVALPCEFAPPAPPPPPFLSAVAAAPTPPGSNGAGLSSNAGSARALSTCTMGVLGIGRSESARREGRCSGRATTATSCSGSCGGSGGEGRRAAEEGSVGRLAVD